MAIALKGAGTPSELIQAFYQCDLKAKLTRT
jgi:hypothetical protein